jgi:light-regulated signal transduction histidine kinase (bacteriophytochrome)
MGKLIDDLLTFSRFSRQPLEKQCVAPGNIVRQVLEQFRYLQEGRRIEISIGDLPLCQSDPSLLRVVYTNLLSNALKFTGKRDYTLIEIGCKDEESEHVYYVKDNGVGFNMKYVEKLFGVFQRLHRADEYEGTGVGLANVQRIIHRHGGRIWVTSELDKGTTFYFTLEKGGKLS